MKPGYYLARMRDTSGDDGADDIFCAFDWTIKDSEFVELIRKQLSTIDSLPGVWCVLQVGPGPKLVTLEGLPIWADKRLGDEDLVTLTRRQVDLLFERGTGSHFYRVDCDHMAVSDISLHIAAYGKYTGRKFETHNLE